MRKKRRRVGVRAPSGSAAPVHPGIWLENAYLREYGVSQNALARAMGISPRRVNEIVLGQRAITGETALLLEEATGYSAQMWMGLQAEYELEVAREALARRPAREKVPLPPMEEPMDPGCCADSGGEGYGVLGNDA
jgi:addiction module HigA family antidote